MKKILLVLLFISTAAFAHGPYGPYGHGHGYWAPSSANGWTWLAPAVVGGVIGYQIAKPQQQVIVQQVPPPIVVQQESCSPWTEIMNPDGSTTVTRTCRVLPTR